jgi:hypothetical protein
MMKKKMRRLPLRRKKRKHKMKRAKTKRKKKSRKTSTLSSGSLLARTSSWELSKTPATEVNSLSS